MGKTRKIEATTTASIENKDEIESRILHKTISAKYFIPSPNSNASNLFCWRNFYYNASQYSLPPKRLENNPTSKRIRGKYSIKKINEIVALLFVHKEGKPLPFSGLSADGHWCSTVLRWLNPDIWEQIYGLKLTPEEKNVQKAAYFFKNPEFEDQKAFHVVSLKNPSHSGLTRQFLGDYNVLRQEDNDHPTIINLIKGLPTEMIKLPLTKDLRESKNKRDELKSMLILIERKIGGNVKRKKEVFEQIIILKEKLNTIAEVLGTVTGGEAKTLFENIVQNFKTIKEDPLDIVKEKFTDVPFMHPEDDNYEASSELFSMFAGITLEASICFGIRENQRGSGGAPPRPPPGPSGGPDEKPQGRPPSPREPQGEPHGGPHRAETGIRPIHQFTDDEIYGPAQEACMNLETPHETSEKKDAENFGLDNPFSGQITDFDKKLNQDEILEESVESNQTPTEKSSRENLTSAERFELQFKGMQIGANYMMCAYNLLCKEPKPRAYFFDTASKLEKFQTDIWQTNKLAHEFHKEGEKVAAFIGSTSQNHNNLLKIEYSLFCPPGNFAQDSAGRCLTQYKNKNFGIACKILNECVVNNEDPGSSDQWKLLPKIFVLYCFVKLLRETTNFPDEQASLIFSGLNESLNRTKKFAKAKELRDAELLGFRFD